MLGRQPLMATAVNRQRQIGGIELAVKKGAPPASLHGLRQCHALVKGLPALVIGAIAAEKNGGSAHRHGLRSVKGWETETGPHAPFHDGKAAMSRDAPFHDAANVRATACVSAELTLSA